MNSLIMNSLPYEVIRAIQERLPLYERAVIAPQISKDWYDVISPMDHQVHKNKLYAEIFVKNKNETIFPFHARGAFHCEFTTDLKWKLFNAIVNNDDSKFMEMELKFGNNADIHSNSFDVIFDSPEINPHYEYCYKTICKIQKTFSERTSNAHPYTRQILEFDTLFVRVSQIDCLLSYEVCIAGHVLDFHLRRRIQNIYELNVKTLSFIKSIDTLPSELCYDHEGKITSKPNAFNLSLKIEDGTITYTQYYGFTMIREFVHLKKKSLIVWSTNEILNETIENIPSCKLSQFIRWCIIFKTMEKIAGVVNTSVKIG